MSIFDSRNQRAAFTYPEAQPKQQGQRGSQYKRATIAYGGITVFCVLFNALYAQFSYGVDSPWMTFMFLFPLIGGVGVYGVRALLNKKPLPRFSYNAYNSGIATLIMGSLLRGVFEIAGAASPYQNVLLVVGVGFLGVSVISAFVGKKRG